MTGQMHEEKILILDFGSQYTQLIARRVRELKVYCEIHPFNMSAQKIRAFAPKGVILSGSPSSVYGANAPACDMSVWEMDAPKLGICYGLQVMVHSLGGKVAASKEREYGHAELEILDSTSLFSGFSKGSRTPVWMSHGDRVVKLPKGFEVIARSTNSPYAAIRDKAGKNFGVQFHPEVVHTPKGKAILRSFLRTVCKCRPLWNMRSFIEETIESVRNRVGDSEVVLGLSGGVDSSVVAALLHRALGNKVHSIFVDNGLLRLDEEKQVVDTFRKQMGMKLIAIDAGKRFLDRLEGVEDPEKKRKIIGSEFIYVFEEEAKKLKGVKYLAQGTLYPDVIESVSFKGPSATIKSHHNVGGLPERMNLELIEPLRELFKDEVREVGRRLCLPDVIIGRQPFPGPGLAVRILGSVTKDRLRVLRLADHIVASEIKRAGLYDKVWQSFAVLLPVKTVGVMGDERTYENVIAVRAVTSLDGMTADWAKLPNEVLASMSNRIINEVKGINRVVYDVSSKPPSTIEWE